MSENENSVLDALNQLLQELDNADDQKQIEQEDLAELLSLFQDHGGES